MSSPTTSSPEDGPRDSAPSAGARATKAPVRPRIVGVAGGSGSGKSTVVRRVQTLMGRHRVSVISHDSYYRDQSHIPFAERVKLNFDHPDALETDLLVEHLEILRTGRPVEIPVYDYASHIRHGRRRRVVPNPLVLIDGILVLADERVRERLDFAVYVHTEPEERLARRIRRDGRSRGRDARAVIEQFHRTVRPMHDQHVEPTRAHANLTIAQGGHNEVAIARLMSELERLLAVT